VAEWLCYLKLQRVYNEQCAFREKSKIISFHHSSRVNKAAGEADGAASCKFVVLPAGHFALYPDDGICNISRQL
jgi:hypothetical protein